MILRRKFIKVKIQRRMLQLQRTRPKQSRTKDHNKLQHRLQRRMKNLPDMFVYLMVIVCHALTMDIWPRIVKLLIGTAFKDHHIRNDHSSTVHIYLMIIVFHVLTTDIWPRIVKLLISTTIKDHFI